MDRQVFELTGRTLALSDVFPTQATSGATEAGKNTIQQAKDIIVPFKSYKALISQASTSAPTVTIIVNEFSAPIVWARSTTGNYTGTLSGAFTSGKTFIPSIHQSFPIVDRSIYTFWVDANTIAIQSRAISTTAFADIGQSESFIVEINVYN